MEKNNKIISLNPSIDHLYPRVYMGVLVFFFFGGGGGWVWAMEEPKMKDYTSCVCFGGGRDGCVYVRTLNDFIYNMHLPTK